MAKITKPKRAYNAARQLGAINDILKPHSKPTRETGSSQTRTYSGARPGNHQHDLRRTQQNRMNCWHEGIRQQQHVPQPNILQQHNITQQPRPAMLQERMTRDDIPRQSLRSSRSSRSPRRRDNERRLRSPRRERPDESSQQQKREPKNERRSQSKLANSLSVNISNIIPTGSDKRKRLDDDTGDDEGRNKKHQTAPADAERPKQPFRRTLKRQGSDATKSEYIAEKSISASSSQEPRKEQKQLPGPASSNVTPEHDTISRDQHRSSPLLSEGSMTPTSAEKRPEQQRQSQPNRSASQALQQPEGSFTKFKATTPPEPVSRIGSTEDQMQEQRPESPSPAPSSTTQPNKKRQRDDADNNSRSSKRSGENRTESSALMKKDCTPSAEGSPQACAPVLARVLQAQAVRPEASFAPVVPNPEYNFKFLDHDHESVPVLYSTNIRHAEDTTLLNCPPEELIFDALDAIEAGFKPYSRYGWPSAIGLLDRTARKDSPTRVLDDVDLYLHKTDGKLYVATERGLIMVPDYLKLLGVPETQPVKFAGRIPAWAKAGLKAREVRRVVQIFGKIITNKQKKRSVHEVSGQETKDEQVKQMTLKAERPDELALPLGSSVIVYKIDHNDEWAYGRLCDSGEKGWFPISHTCPADWSQDRFSKSNRAPSIEPSTSSMDPEWKDWNGLSDFIEKQGFPLGKTWKETQAASAAEAVRKKASNLLLAARFAAQGFSRKMPTPQEMMGMKTATVTAVEPTKGATPSNSNPETVGKEQEATHLVEHTAKSAATIEAARSASHAATETTNHETELVQGTEAAVNADTDTAGVESLEGQYQNAPDITQVFAQPDATGTSLTETKTEIDATPAKTREVVEEQDASQEAEKLKQTETLVAEAQPVRDPFTVPRYNLWARNDDIEVDWDDSDVEL